MKKYCVIRLFSSTGPIHRRSIDTHARAFALLGHGFSPLPS